jgi:Putative antitoxin of bacterial toxin-antitoxin system, YdaS/YdaT
MVQRIPREDRPIRARAGYRVASHTVSSYRVGTRSGYAVQSTHSSEQTHANISRKALLRAIDLAGSQSELGRMIGAFQSTVYYWLNLSVRGVPPEAAIKIEKAVGVTRQELRPDLW